MSLAELVESRYLRALPYDPIAESSEAWLVLPPPEGYEGGVSDLHSGAAGEGDNGQLYADW
jgi:general secretion pathway protein G